MYISSILVYGRVHSSVMDDDVLTMVAVHLLKYLIFTHTIIIPSLLATQVAGGIYCQAEQMNYV